MPSRRSLRRLLRVTVSGPTATALALGSLAAGACAPKGVAISECREIESARCEASVPCGVVEDVDACKRFYRDQCLHGIVGDKPPTAAEQRICVGAITAAGRCAEDDPDQTLSACADAEGGIAGGNGSGDGPSVCEFIAAPWEQRACDFLNESHSEGGSSG